MPWNWWRVDMISPLLVSFAFTINNQGPDRARNQYLTLAETAAPRNRQAIYNMLSDWNNMKRKIEDIGDFEPQDEDFTPGVGEVIFK